MVYAFTAPLVVPAPTGSHVDFTLVLIGTNLKMATVANGGQVVNTVVRNGQTVPADLVLSSDAAGLSLYSFGWDYYNAVTGQGVMWVKIPSYTVGMTIYVSVGAASVTTYQGGAQGAEFGSSTMFDAHLPNGSVLNAVDFSASAFAVSAVTATATAGQVDGGAAFNSQKIDYGNIALNVGSAFTIRGWLNTTSNNSFPVLIAKDAKGAGNSHWEIYIDRFGAVGGIAGELRMYAPVFGDMGSGTAVVTGAWVMFHVTYDGANVRWYINGAATTSPAATGSVVASTAPFWLGSESDASQPYVGSLDEIAVLTAVQTAARNADEYANQFNPPVIGAFTANSTLRTLASTGVGR